MVRVGLQIPGAELLPRDQEQDESRRFFRILKRRTKVFANNVNARRLHVHVPNIIIIGLSGVL